jgi:hypothetical protein
VLLVQQGKAALRDVPDPPHRLRPFDRIHVVIEADTEVGVVPAHDRIFHSGHQELQIVAQLDEAEWLVIDGGIDAEAAGVGTAEAADHRYDLDGGGLLQRCLDELPPLGQVRHLQRLPGGGEVPAYRPVLVALAADLGDGGPVGES